MCSRLGANAPKNFIAIAIVDKDIEGVYNNRTSKNRGIKMDKNFRTVLVLWMVLAICWLFLKIGSEIKRDRMLDEASERASEASERAKRDLERTRQAYREKWGEEPTF